MDCTMILCDWAEAVNGKLYCQGGGWSYVLMDDEPLNCAIGLIVAVPWTEANKPHQLQVRLQTEDGTQVTQDDQEVRMGGQIEVGRPPGIKPGSELNAIMALRFNGLSLGAGGYVWTLFINDEPQARTPFWVLGKEKVQ